MKWLAIIYLCTSEPCDSGHAFTRMVMPEPYNTPMACAIAAMQFVAIDPPEGVQRRIECEPRIR
jgi:hypothetical protein